MNDQCPKCKRNKTFRIQHHEFGECLRCAVCQETFIPLAWDGEHQSFIAESDLKKMADAIKKDMEDVLSSLEWEENDRPDHYWN